MFEEQAGEDRKPSPWLLVFGLGCMGLFVGIIGYGMIPRSLRVSVTVDETHIGPASIGGGAAAAEDPLADGIGEAESQR